MLNFVFDTQKAELENLHAGSPEERKGIAWALRLNRQALEFAAEGRNLEAHVQFMFGARPYSISKRRSGLIPIMDWFRVIKGQIVSIWPSYDPPRLLPTRGSRPLTIQ